MGQFSVEKPVAPGSVLSGNQQRLGLTLDRNACHRPRLLRSDRTGRRKDAKLIVER